MDACNYLATRKRQCHNIRTYIHIATHYSMTFGQQDSRNKSMNCACLLFHCKSELSCPCSARLHLQYIKCTAHHYTKTLQDLKLLYRIRLCTLAGQKVQGGEACSPGKVGGRGVEGSEGSHCELGS